MPIYEFRCGRCRKEFEKLVAGAGTRVSCPHCGARKVERKFSVFGAKTGAKFTGSVGSGSCGSCSSSSCASCK